MYLKVERDDFQFIKTGEFIMWNKISDDNKKVGAVIERIGEYEGRKNWRLNNKKGSFTLYWDNIDSVEVRPDIFYERLRKKTDQISTALLFLAKKLNLDTDLNEFMSKIF